MPMAEIDDMLFLEAVALFPFLRVGVSRRLPDL